MAAGIGGGFKVNLLAKAMEKLKDNANMIVMFVDRQVSITYQITDLSIHMYTNVSKCSINKKTVLVTYLILLPLTVF